MNKTLAQAGIFEDLAPATITALTSQLPRVSFPLGHTIFREGDPGDLLYIITNGKVKLAQQTPRHRDRVIAVLGPGDIFGELALLDPGPRTCTITTLTRLNALTVDQSALRSWIADRPPAAEHLLRALARRLRRASSATDDLVFLDVPGRVAKLLLELSSRYGEYDSGALRVNHELPQAEFAQLVGTSRESVNKALSTFVDRGWINLRGKSILIFDTASLATRAQ